MTANIEYTPGETVLIIKGIYKRMYKKGEYVRRTGEKSIVVILGGKERTIRYDSIAKIPMSASNGSNSSNTVTISREAYIGMVTEIDSLTSRLNALEIKMKRHLN